MRDHQQAGRAAEGAIEGAAEIVRIQGSEAFVQDDQVGALEQCPGDEETASLAVGKLPTGLSHHLLQTPRRARARPPPPPPPPPPPTPDGSAPPRKKNPAGASQKPLSSETSVDLP